ncbi:hypothetical protein HJG60_009033 [Phyllostomus discolor]|uniref:Uncharacterized protein n=1 Tax=Phyllostomus discolor TaxID=89673 RepID=A0A833YLU9_9CHIR|nr:hypothetical protein HJG60_009033 [Phyllostomus discolor]
MVLYVYACARLCVCMCVNACICFHACMCTHTCAPSYMHGKLHTHVYMCLCVSTHVCLCICVYRSVFVCEHVFVYVIVCTCVYGYICGATAEAAGPMGPNPEVMPRRCQCHPGWEHTRSAACERNRWVKHTQTETSVSAVRAGASRLNSLH